MGKQHTVYGMERALPTSNWLEMIILNQVQWMQTSKPIIRDMISWKDFIHSHTKQ